MVNRKRDIHAELIISDDGKTVTWDRAWDPGSIRLVTRLTWNHTRYVPTGGNLVTAMWTGGDYHRINLPVLVEDYAYRRIFGRNIITGKVRNLYDTGWTLKLFGRSIFPRGEKTKRIVEIGSRNRFIIDWDTEMDKEHIGEDETIK